MRTRSPRSDLSSSDSDTETLHYQRSIDSNLDCSMSRTASTDSQVSCSKEPLVPRTTNSTGPSRLAQASNNSQSRTKCRYCSETFAKPSNLRQHERRHETPTEKIKCIAPGCSKKYGRQADLNRHTGSVGRVDLTVEWTWTDSSSTIWVIGTSANSASKASIEATFDGGQW